MLIYVRRHGMYMAYLFSLLKYLFAIAGASYPPMACSLNGSIIHDLHNDFLNGTHPAVTQTLYILRHLVPSLK